MAILDASVQIALVNRADHHRDAARAWYRAASLSAEPLYAPWILVAEVAAGIRRGRDDEVLARQVVEHLMVEDAIRLVPVDAELTLRAAAIAIDHSIRGCDAVYVALAAMLGEMLVTFDEQQAERAAGVVTVLRPGIG